MSIIKQEVPIVIGGVSKIVIEVEDQERAKKFWTETLGFEVAQDAPYGQERWLEVRTPDKAVVVVLDVRKGERPTPRDPSLPTSNVFFHAEDLQQTYQELSARGVQFPRRRSSSRLAGGRCSRTPTATGSPWSPAASSTSARLSGVFWASSGWGAHGGEVGVDRIG